MAHPVSSSAQRALVNLAVDVFTAEVVRALQKAGIRPILLKGPSIASWLYKPGERVYTDCDLLVSPDDRPATEQVLSSLGFETRVDDGDVPGVRLAVIEWRRASDGASLDLHRTLPGAAADEAEVWTVVSEGTATVSVGGATVEVTSTAMRTVQLALHAARHGAREPRPLSDLARALELDDGIWREAASLATELGAIPAFQTGLRLLPAGCALADRLMLPYEKPRLMALSVAGPPAGALSFECFFQARGWRARTHFFLRKVVPTRKLMLAWSPLARRGRAGLAAAYVWRPIWLALRAVPGFIAWHRAVRRHSSLIS